ALPGAADVSRDVTLWQPAHGGHVGFAGGRWPGHLGALPQSVAGWLSQALPETAATAGNWPPRQVASSAPAQRGDGRDDSRS
ncbi:MAG: hypothetical protein ABIQ33_10815, partial [Caldimonas sp.]